MNVLRVILGLMIGWIILVLLFFVGLFHVLAGLIRSLFYSRTASAPSADASASVPRHGALEMERCPKCGTYTSGICTSPQCVTK